MRTTSTLVALAIAGALTGCVAHGGAYVATPQLALVGPDLYVVADYSEPVFYTDGFYWLYHDGFWYRSGAWDRGWITVVSVPGVIARIDRPDRYVRYRGGPYYAPRPPVRDHRGPYVHPVQRGNRVPPPRPPTPRFPAPRDHRR